MSFILTSLMMYITGIDNFMQIDELLDLSKKTFIISKQEPQTFCTF